MSFRIFRATQIASGIDQKLHQAACNPRILKVATNESKFQSLLCQEKIVSRKNSSNPKVTSKSFVRYHNCLLSCVWRSLHLFSRSFFFAVLLFLLSVHSYRYFDHSTILFSQAIKLMWSVIHDLIDQSFKSKLFPKAIECVKTLRQGCLQEDEWKKFNDGRELAACFRFDSVKLVCLVYVSFQV